MPSQKAFSDAWQSRKEPGSFERAQRAHTPCPTQMGQTWYSFTNLTRGRWKTIFPLKGMPNVRFIGLCIYIYRLIDLLMLYIYIMDLVCVCCPASYGRKGRLLTSRKASGSKGPFPKLHPCSRVAVSLAFQRLFPHPTRACVRG